MLRDFNLQICRLSLSQELSQGSSDSLTQVTMVQSTTTSNCTSRLPYRHILWIILLPAVMAISDYDITIPSFLYAASTDYFDHPLDELTRWKMVLRAVLYLQGGVIILDFLLCVFLNHWFKHVNTTTDQHRDTRDSRPWYTLSLMTSDYPGNAFFFSKSQNHKITKVHSYFHTLFRTRCIFHKTTMDVEHHCF